MGSTVKRFLVAAALALSGLMFYAQPASATWNLVAKCGDPSGSPSCASGINTTGATLLVAVNGTNSGGATSCPTAGSPSAGTWTAILVKTGGGFGGDYTLCYINNPTGTGAGQTFACNGTLCGIALVAYSGNDTSSPLDQSCSGTANNPTTCASALTPSVAASLVVAATGGPASPSPVISPGTMSVQIAIPGAGGVTYGATIGDEAPVTAARTPGYADGAGNAQGVIMVAIFKPAAGGGATSHPCSALRLLGVGCH